MRSPSLWLMKLCCIEKSTIRRNPHIGEGHIRICLAQSLEAADKNTKKFKGNDATSTSSSAIHKAGKYHPANPKQQPKSTKFANSVVIQITLLLIADFVMLNAKSAIRKDTLPIYKGLLKVALK